jgi:cob(I)alamin adenosyltransferase
MKIYTGKGDDGTTGLLYGGRVPKYSPLIEANGAVDEAQAFLGVARAQCPHGSELASALLAIEADLWVLMAEVATAPENRSKLKAVVTRAMVVSLEAHIDGVTERFEMPKEFVIPGDNPLSAALDVARTVVRRAERLLSATPPTADSFVGPYLNRLSDLLWAMARWQEVEHIQARDVRASP